MSWGYFLDLELSVPTAAWKRLQAIEGRALPSGWWGFRGADLEKRFGAGPTFDNVTFKRALAFFKDGKSCSKHVSEANGRTTVRLTTLLDRGGDTQVARPIAAAFDAAAKDGGAGHIQLVNDGSAPGEPGVVIAIASGALVRERLVDAADRREALSAAVFPELRATIDQYTSPKARAHHAASKRAASPTKVAPEKLISKKPVSNESSPKKKGSKKVPD
jgi:hypothetical protein